MPLCLYISMNFFCFSLTLRFFCSFVFCCLASWFFSYSALLVFILFLYIFSFSLRCLFFHNLKIVFFFTFILIVVFSPSTIPATAGIPEASRATVVLLSLLLWHLPSDATAVAHQLLCSALISTQETMRKVLYLWFSCVSEDWILDIP